MAFRGFIKRIGKGVGRVAQGAFNLATGMSPSTGSSSKEVNINVSDILKGGGMSSLTNKEERRLSKGFETVKELAVKYWYVVLFLVMVIIYAITGGFKKKRPSVRRPGVKRANTRATTAKSRSTGGMSFVKSKPRSKWTKAEWKLYMASIRKKRK